MPRLRLIPAIVAICVVCAASSFACPVAKKVIASDLIEPPPFGFIPGQKCDECPIPDLMVLDFDAGKLPASDHGITDEQVDFLELYFAAGGFFNEAFNNDPRHECMRYFDNHYQPNAKTIREMLPSQPIPPPVGAIADVDYVVGGKITGSRGHYSMTVFLEDAKTRDPITSASVQFSNPGDAMAAGEQAERSMAPLFDKIRDYQKRLRDGSNDMAIRAKLKVTPSRDKMNVGEQQSVEVFVYDCDGEDHPLKNRKIKLSSGNGTFSPAEVTTGSDGKVKATFTAQKKGLAGLDATYYPYTTVTHHESGSHQNATVQIGDPPSGVWQMNIDATETDTDDTVRSTDDDDGHQEVNDHQTIKRTAHVTVWLNSNTETGNIRGSEVIAVSGDGNFDFLSTFHHLSTSPSCSTKGDGRRVAEGTFVPAETVFAFDIYPDHANVNGTIFIKGGGTDDTWGFESCADPPRVHQHQESKDDGYAIELGYGSDQLDAPITPQNKQSRTFKFDLSQHERNQDDKGGVTERTRTGTITLKPLTISQTPPGLRRH